MALWDRLLRQLFRSRCAIGNAEPKDDGDTDPANGAPPANQDLRSHQLSGDTNRPQLNTGHRNDTKTGPPRPWQRPGYDAAQSSRLLGPADPVAISETQLDARRGAAYGFGADLGRGAASGYLVCDMHPGNIGFDGEHFVAFDWGQSVSVDPTAPAMLGWLAEMRATWGDGFVGLSAGFLQGIRAATATSHPNLAPELIAAIGGRFSTIEAAWPLTPDLATRLHRISTVLDGSQPTKITFSALADATLDEEERRAIAACATVLTSDVGKLLSEPQELKVSFSALASVVAPLATKRPRELWLLVFLLMHCGNLACDAGDIVRGAALLQAAHIALQRGSPEPIYFESALACCVHRESDNIRWPSARRSREAVFASLGYCNSYSVTCGRVFSESRKLVDGGGGANAMWTAIWWALDRARSCELAFAAWAARDIALYRAASPGLQMLAGTHAAVVAELVKGLMWASQKSMNVPWLGSLDALLPRLQKEIQWCSSVTEINLASPSAAEVMLSLYAAAVEENKAPHVGIADISFLPDAS